MKILIDGRPIADVSHETLRAAMDAITHEMTAATVREYDRQRDEMRELRERREKNSPENSDRP